MRPRYLLLVSGDEALHDRARAIAAATGLRVAALAPPFAVLVNEDCPCLAASGFGLVIGTLFHGHGPAKAIRETGGNAAGAIATGGLAHLLRSYWGGYVAVEFGPGGVEILRDPSGALGCYRAEAEGVLLFASDLDLLLAGGATVPGIDWNGLASILGSSGLPTARTALRGIETVLPGTAVKLTGGHEEVAQRWSPWEHAASEPVSDEERDARLHRVVQHCVAAWASLWKRPLVSLSGGLDSSIVAACLAAARSDAHCATMFTDDPAGDERSYARDLCGRLGLPLAECRYELEGVDTARPLGLHLPRPVGRAQNQAYERAHIALARREGVDVFFTGNGGDNVFGYSQSAAALVDRVRAEGVGAGACTTLRDICAHTGAGPLRVLRAAWQLGRRAPGYQWKPNLLYLHPEVAARLAGEALRHPWLDAPAGALPGQAAHVSGLVRVQLNIEPDRSLFAPVVNPLLSQPVVEACLAVPSWAWREGGRDRAVARDAFAAQLPASIAQRRTKGTPDPFLGQILRRDRSAIRDRLLGGELARRALLDLPALERALAPDQPMTGEAHMRLLELTNVEAWVSAWVSHLPAAGRPVAAGPGEALPSA